VATPVGRLPTGIVSITLALSGSRRDTVPSCVFATHTAPRPTAIAEGSCPTGVVAVTAFALVGSIRITLSSSASATHTAPWPIAIAVG
jgi:hypothetical protein